MEKDICQFYVVIGDSSFEVPNDNNVYINATNVVDYKLIQDEIFKLYKEKVKLGFTVGSEIIFLVGAISDSEKANDIISKLRLNGKIQVIKKKTQPIDIKIPVNNDIEKLKEIMPKEVKKEKVEEVKVSNFLDEEKDIKNEKNIDKLDSNKIEENNKQLDNIYKRDFDSNNYSGYIGKPIEKKDKFSKVTVIVFIISLLLFITSLVLLVVV